MKLINHLKGVKKTDNQKSTESGPNDAQSSGTSSTSTSVSRSEFSSPPINVMSRTENASIMRETTAASVGGGDTIEQTTRTTVATYGAPQTIPMMPYLPPEDKELRETSGFGLFDGTKDIILFVVVFILYFVVMFLNNLGAAVADRHYLFTVQSQLLPLEDTFRRVAVPWFVGTRMRNNVSDIFVIVAVVLTLVRALALGRKCFKVLRRLMMVTAFVLSFRTISSLLTYLPSPFYGCVTFPHPDLGLDAFMILLRMRDTCGDVFFSGYAVHYTVCSMVWAYYPLINRRWGIILSLPIIAFNTLASVALVATQHSYSIDVITGVLITWGTFNVIFYLCDVPFLKYETIGGMILGLLDDPLYAKRKSRHLLEKEYLTKARNPPYGSLIGAAFTTDAYKHAINTTVVPKRQSVDSTASTVVSSEGTSSGSETTQHDRITSDRDNIDPSIRRPNKTGDISSYYMDSNKMLNHK